MHSLKNIHIYVCDREIRITKPIEQNGSPIKASDLYPGGDRFESRPEHNFRGFPLSFKTNAWIVSHAKP
jgi:hypothetical protein